MLFVVWVLIESEWDGQMGSIEKRMERKKRDRQREKRREGVRWTNSEKKNFVVVVVCPPPVCLCVSQSGAKL